MVWNDEVYVIGEDTPRNLNISDKEIVRLTAKTFDPMQAHRHSMFSSWPAWSIWDALND